MPQYILEDAIDKGRGGACTVLCAQPRRVAAISLAQRVAAERGEQVGRSVGYSIRLESKMSASTRLLFCTTGVVLRRLQARARPPLISARSPAAPELARRRLQEGGNSLQGVSHVIVDEAHERSEDGDFLLFVLKQLMPHAPQLRVVLMSATLDAGLFCGYYGGCPALTIPGRTFGVTALHLEDALELTGHAVRAGADWARKPARRPRAGEEDPAQAPLARRDDEYLDADQLRARYPGYGAKTIAALGKLDFGTVNNELIAQLVAWLLAAPARDVPTLLRCTRLPGHGGGHGGGGGGPAEAAVAPPLLQPHSLLASAVGGMAPPAEERRYDYDGELYTKEEFILEYGGTKEWEAAERPPPVRPAEAWAPPEEPQVAAAAEAAAALSIQSKGKKGRGGKKGGGGGGGGDGEGAGGGSGGGGGGGGGGALEGGAILVFLPGMKEITTLLELLQNAPGVAGKA